MEAERLVVIAAEEAKIVPGVVATMPALISSPLPPLPRPPPPPSCVGGGVMAALIKESLPHSFH